MHRLDLLRCVGLLLLLARPVTILMVELPMLPAAVAAEAPQPAEDFVDEEAKQHRDQEDERRRESEKEQPLLHHLEVHRLVDLVWQNLAHILELLHLHFIPQVLDAVLPVQDGQG